MLKGRAVPEFPESLPDPIEPGFAAAEREAALERGVAVHRLLQMLPDTDPAEREDLAARWLERQYSGWAEADRREAVTEAMRIVGDERLAPLFAPGSRAEAGIAGNVWIGGREVLVSGQIDRLAVSGDEILLADYKTGRTSPGGPERVEEAYLLQMALYRVLLRQIYPEKAVRCLLVRTRDGTIQELDVAEMDAALASITPA